MEVYIGIDWSEHKHDICILNAAGTTLAHLTMEHSPEGFDKLEVLRQQLGCEVADCLVSLETAHNLLIDFLWGHGYTQVYVIPPNVIKSSRTRYRQTGARTDQSDAYVIADVLRTDRARLLPWRPDSLLTRQMRAKISFLLYLTHSRVRLSNRLRAILLRYYPAALHVFSQLDTQIALRFIIAYPTPQAATALSLTEFLEFAKEQGYTQPKKLPKCYARLQQAYPQADADTVLVYQQEAIELATLLLQLVQTRAQHVHDLQRMYRQHADAPIFASIPGAGELLAPGLLVKFGDDRARFPTAASVQALAGTCPVTEASGKRHVIYFRRACDHEFRSLAHSLAVSSIQQSTWSRAYWESVRQRGGTDTHAYRCLANRWLAIIWKLWQTHQPYDETYHMRQRAVRSKPKR